MSQRGQAGPEDQVRTLSEMKRHSGLRSRDRILQHLNRMPLAAVLKIV
jgi:hypothetical protein